MSVTTWAERAACTGADELIFFPPSGVSPHEARRICEDCPVRMACLRVALDAERGLSARSRYGVYGGLTPYQRAKLARKAKR